VAQWFQFTSWPYITGESLLIFASLPTWPCVQPPPSRPTTPRSWRLHLRHSPGRPTASTSSRCWCADRTGAVPALVAAAPTLFIKFGGFSQATARALGGTSVLIVVGVAIDTMRQIESQLSMRSYKGFLK
jgi:preprotein translocase subunit SecY